MDYQLQWDEADYGGIGVLRLPPDKVWKPDIVLFNKYEYYKKVICTSLNLKNIVDNIRIKFNRLHHFLCQHNVIL